LLAHAKASSGVRIPVRMPKVIICDDTDPVKKALFTLQPPKD
jgi:hypothetical protein